MSEALQKLQKYKTLIKENWMLWIKSQFEQIDKVTSWVIPWKVYTIWAYSNSWKSKLSYDYVNHFLAQGKKVNYYSLEVDAWMVLLNLFANKEKKAFWVNLDSDIYFYKNLKIFDDIYDLEDILEHIMEDKPEIVFIDFVQNIQAPWWDYERMTKVAVELQQVAIKSNATIFNLSQVANETAKEIHWNKSPIISLKWSWALFASSDIVFILRKLEDWLINLNVAKNKFGRAWDDFVFYADFATWQFNLVDSEKLKKWLWQ